MSQAPKPVQSRNRGASNSVEVPRSPQTKQIVVAAMRKLFGAVFRCSKNGQTFRSCNSDGPLSHIKGSIACRISVGGGGGDRPRSPKGRAVARGLPTRFHACWRCFTQKQLRSIKMLVDSNHGIYRVPTRAFTLDRCGAHSTSATGPCASV